MHSGIVFSKVSCHENVINSLQFVTGTSSVPFEGFRALRGSNGPKRFTIDFFNDVNSLPRCSMVLNPFIFVS